MSGRQANAVNTVLDYLYPGCRHTKGLASKAEFANAIEILATAANKELAAGWLPEEATRAASHRTPAEHLRRTAGKRAQA